VVKILANYNSVNLNRLDKDGISPLQIAELNGHASAVAFLTRDSRVYLDSQELSIVLWHAAQKDHSDVVGALSNLDMVDVNYISQEDKAKRTPLLVALSGRHVDTTDTLLRCVRVDASIPDANGNLAVDIAAALGYEGLFRDPTGDITFLSGHF
jgi:ankyrin repeat protein